MRNTWRKFLSVVVALTMVLSLTVTGFAAPMTKEEAYRSGHSLELQEVDPGTLNVPRRGNTPAESAEPQHSDEDMVRVSIFLEEAPTLERFQPKGIADNAAARYYRNSLARQQANVTRRVEGTLGKSLDVVWNLTLAVNAISANVRYGDIEKIESVPGVKKVALENVFEIQKELEPAYPDTAITSEYMVGATAAWAAGYTGAGSKIAIIDTGTGINHISFSGEGFEYSLQKNAEAKGMGYDEYVASLKLLTAAGVDAVADQLNASKMLGSTLSSADAYISSKLPYAFSYVDGDFDITNESAQSNHGSHVAGIAAANRYVPQGEEFVDSATSVGAVGMAPDAQILTMKVFGKGGGAYDSDYMAAIEDAVILGCDSANLSLGSANPGYSFSDDYQDVMESLTESTLAVIISAGNSYAWPSFLQDPLYPYLYADDVSMQTDGSPGSFTNSLTVASAENVGSIAAPVIFNGDQTVYYTETSSYGNREMISAAGTYDFVYIDAPGTDEEFAAVADILNGNVALCNRGSSSFFEKVNAAAAAGAIAVIIVNNQDGVINMNLTGVTTDIPAVSVLKAVGVQLKANAEPTPVTVGESEINYYTGSIEIVGEKGPAITTDVPTIDDFSSWGVPGSLQLKPEITAPGGSILSVSGFTTDQYEVMSGTSMAAPHAAGLAAILGQYIRETGLDKTTGRTARQLINSLLMSTAVPMVDEKGSYYPVMRQGAGLANVANAFTAKSYIWMGDNATVSAGDGKVKVELGDDPDQKGVYTYDFTINNFSNVDLAYELSTDLFSQWLTMDPDQGVLLMNQNTIDLTVDDSYSWTSPEVSYDVNVDGETNQADVQAILDKVTGEYPEEDPFDAEVADMDNDGAVTSYDAYLLLQMLEKLDDGTDLIVPAGESVTVTVTLALDAEEMEILNGYFTNGFYVEGFTYANCTSLTGDGEILDVEHSIPILGFCGNWSDAAMFDRVTAADLENETNDRSSYMGYETNGLAVQAPGASQPVFLVGNPYVVDEHVERAAVGADTTLYGAVYTLIRNAARLGIFLEDAEGNVIWSNGRDQAISAYYYVNGAVWRNNTPVTERIGATPAKLGLSEGDSFKLRMIAAPEYYAMDKGGVLTDDDLRSMVEDGTLGAGASVEVEATVDGTAPEILSAELNADKTVLTVTAKDNAYIAYVTLLDLNGKTELVEGVVPEQSAPGETVTVTFEVNAEEMGSGAIVFVGDYAALEAAALARLGDGPITRKEVTYFQLTNTLEAGKVYLISSMGEAGETKLLTSPGASGYDVLATDATIVDDPDKGLIIPADGVDANAMWDTAAYNDGVQFLIGDLYLGCYEVDDPYCVWSRQERGDPFVYTDSRLQFANNPERGLYFDDASGNFNYGTPGALYLFVGVEEDVEIDPEAAESVTVTPESGTLVLGTGTTLQLTAAVEPIYIPDKSVTWSSSDESIATVDENGIVSATGLGTAIITASSNATPEVTGSAEILVVEVDKDLNGIVWDEEGEVWPAAFNVKTIPAYDKLTGESLRTRLTSLTYDENGVLWGCDLDTEEGLSNLYTVDPDTWEITPSGGSTQIGYMDLCMAPSLGDHYLLGVFGTYVVIIDKATGEYEAAFDLRNYVSGNLVGITYEEQYFNTNYNMNVDWVFLLDANGNIYTTGILPNPSGDGTFSRFSVTAVGNMGEAVDTPYFQSLYFDGADLIWSRFNEADNVVQINMVQDLYGKEPLVFPVGTFADGVWPVGGLFQLDVRPYFDFESANRAETEGRAAAEIEAATELVEPETLRDVFGSAAKGSTNAVTAAAPAVRLAPLALTEEAEPETGSTVAVDLIDTADATSGTYTVTYDPAVLTYVDYDSEQEFISVHNDADSGVITVAFANLEAVTAGEIIATLNFEGGCDDSVVTTTVDERNDELDLEEPLPDTTVPGEGHEWGEPTWEWNADKTAATATFVCGNDPDHVEVLDATVTSEVVEPTCEEKGYTTNTATVTGPDGKTYTDSVTGNEKEPIGHDWGEPTYEWAEDNSTVTATFVCKNDPSHTYVTTVKTESKTDDNGVTTWTGTVTGPDGKTYTPEKDNGVKTGDTFQIGLYAGILVACAGAMVVLLRSRKKEN